MKQYEVIADRIEEALARMFHVFSEFESKPSEYSLYFNPKLYGSWFIEIYFSDSKQIGTAIGNGTCYQIQGYLQEEFNGFEELKYVERSIFFEFGNRPSNEEEYYNRHLILIEKTKRLLGAKGQSDIKLCHSCGHDFSIHQLRSFGNEGNDAPSHGWIICPEENCNCFLTWDASFNGKEK